MSWPPDRVAVGDRIRDLVVGRATREAVADWASTWVIKDGADVDDPVVWQALTELAGADLKVSAGDYLHGEDDFRDWLRAVEQPGSVQ